MPINLKINQFTHKDIERLFLNSEDLPYKGWNLNFTNKLESLAHYVFGDLKRGD